MSNPRDFIMQHGREKRERDGEREIEVERKRGRAKTA